MIISNKRRRKEVFKMGKKIYAVKEWDDKIHYFKVNENQRKILEDLKKVDLIEGLIEIKEVLPVESIIEVETSVSLLKEKKYIVL